MQISEAEFRFLTPEERARAKDYETLFGSVGWKRFQKELLERANLIKNNAIALNTEQELFFAKGQIAVLVAVVSFDKGIEYEYKNLIAEAEEKRLDEREDSYSNE